MPSREVPELRDGIRTPPAQQDGAGPGGHAVKATGLSLGQGINEGSKVNELNTLHVGKDAVVLISETGKFL